MSGRPRAERVETLGRRGGIRPRPSSVCQNGGSRGPGLTLSSGSTGPSGLCSRAVTAQVWNRVQALGPRRGSAARLFCAERGKAHRQLLGLWLLLVEGAPLPHNGAGRGPRSGKGTFAPAQRLLVRTPLPHDHSHTHAGSPTGPHFCGALRRVPRAGVGIVIGPWPAAAPQRTWTSRAHRPPARGRPAHRSSTLGGREDRPGGAALP